MWMNFISSDTIKFFVDLLDILVKIVDKVGVLNTALGILFAGQSLKKDSIFGSFFTNGLMKGDWGKWLDSKAGGITDWLSNIFSKDGANVVSDAMDNVADSAANATNNVIDFSAAVQGQASAGATAAATNRTVAATEDGVGASATTASIGVKLLNAALSFGLGILVSIVATKVVSWIADVINSQEKLNKSATDVINTYSNAKKELSLMKNTLDDVSDDYKKLSKGVDAFGNNISLSTSEYERYNQIVKRIAEQFPEMVSGYDKEGNAILKCKDNVEELTAAYEAAAQAARDEIITGGGDDVFNAFMGKYNKSSIGIFGGDSGLKQQQDTAKAIIDLLDRGASNKEIEDFLRFDYGGWKNDVVNTFEAAGVSMGDFTNWLNQVDVEKLKEFRPQLLALIRSTTSEINTEVGKVKSIMDAYLLGDKDENFNYQMLRDEARSAVDILISNMDAEFIRSRGFGSASGMYNWIKANIIAPLNDPQTGAQATEALQNLLNPSTNVNWAAYKSSAEEYRKQLWQSLGGLNNTLGENGKALPFKQVMQMFGIDLKDFGEYERKISDKLTELWGMSSERAKEYINNLDPLTVQRLFEVNWEDVTSAKELQKIIDNALLPDFELDLTAEKQSLDALNTALSETASATGLTVESIAALKSRYSELADAGYNLDELFEETTNGIHLNAKALGELEQAYAKQNLDGINKKLTSLTDEYDDLTDEIKNCGNAYKRAELYAERDKIQSQIKELATLASQYDGLTSAYQKWKNAQSAGNERDMYENIISGRKELEEEMDRGWLDEGSRKYLELLSGKDLSTASWDEVLEIFKQVNATIAGTSYDVFDFFTQDADGNATSQGIYNFFDALIQKQKELGKEWVKMSEDGSYTFDFGVDGDKAIADALGISEELVQIILRAARDAGFDINLKSAYSSLADLQNAADAANDKLKQLGKTEFIFNVNSTNLSNVEDQIKEAKDIYESFVNEDGTLNIEAEGFYEAQILLATLIRQKQELETPAILSIDTNGADTDVQNAVRLLNDFLEKNNTVELQTEIGGDTTEASAELQAVVKKIQESADAEVLVALGIDKNSSVEEINAAIQKLKEDPGVIQEILIKAGIDEKEVQAFVEGEHDTTATCLWENDTKLVDDFMAENHDITARVIWKSDTSKLTTPTSFWPEFANGTAHVSGTLPSRGSAFASGSWGLKSAEHNALVGELGTELVSDPNTGTYYTVGDNGAELVDLPKGAVIFNHKQTEALLKNGYVNSRGKAHMRGTAHMLAVGDDVGSSPSAWLKERDKDRDNHRNRALMRQEALKMAYTIADEELRKKYLNEIYAEIEDIFASWGSNNNTKARNAISSLARKYKSDSSNLAGSSGAGGGSSAVKNAVQKYGSGTVGGSDSKQPVGGSDSKQLIDFIEIKLNEIEANISKTTAKLESYADDASDSAIKNKKDAYDTLIKAEKNKASTYKQAADYYNKEADKLLAKIPFQYRDMAQNGAIAIKDFVGNNNTKVAERIQEYRDMAEKADNAENGYYEAIAQQAQYRVDQLEDIASDYENLNNQLSNMNDILMGQMEVDEKNSQSYYGDIAKNLKASMNNAQREYNTLLKQFQQDVADGTLIKGTDAYFSAEGIVQQARIDALNYASEFEDTLLESFNDISSKFENKIGLIQTGSDMLQAQINLIEESGERVGSAYYKGLITNTQAVQQQLTQQRDALIQKLNDAVAAGLEIGGSEWYEMRNAIAETDVQILECKTDIEGFNNAIRDLRWDNLDKLISRFDNLNSELSHIYTRLTDGDIVDEVTGEWNSKGVAAMGVLSQQMEVAQVKSQQFADQIDYLNKNWKKDGYSVDQYNEKLAELTEQQWDSIEAYEDAKDAIIDLNKTRVDTLKNIIQKEIDAYQKLINKKKETLDADKDARDFKKNVAEKQKNISNIERKIAALSTDTSASAVAQRKQLEAELLEAKADLEDTYYDHSIENQKTALDKEYENFEEQKTAEQEKLDEYLKKEEQVVSDSMNTVKVNANTVLGEINDISKTYGIEISSSITNPWHSGAAAIDDYKIKFQELSSVFALELKNIIDAQNQLQLAAEKSAQSMTGIVSGGGVNYVSTTGGGSYSGSAYQKYTGGNEKMENEIAVYAEKYNQGRELALAGDPKGLTMMRDANDSANQIRNSYGYAAELANEDINYVKKHLGKGYAKGTTNAPKSGLDWVDELGEELQLVPGQDGRLEYIKKGTGIIPAKLTERLMDLAIDPSRVLENSKPAINIAPVTNNDINVTMQIDKVVNIEHADNTSIPAIKKAVNDQLEAYQEKINNKLKRL